MVVIDSNDDLEALPRVKELLAEARGDLSLASQAFQT